MKKETRKIFYIAICMLIAFVLWTIALYFVDVRAIGPQETSVGMATVNAFFHDITGEHMVLYAITDWMGLVPLGFVIGFASLGFVQWIKRKSIKYVDYSILVLGAFYIIVMAVYVIFEMVVVNYRPVLINGHLEASYPSSTTMLALCVMPTAIIQFNLRIENRIFRRCVAYIIIAFTIFMVIGRLVSGVHWFSDIIGGILLSAGLVIGYYAFLEGVK